LPGMNIRGKGSSSNIWDESIVDPYSSLFDPS